VSFCESQDNIDATDPVASEFVGTDFDDIKSVRQFTKSDTNLCVGTQSMPIAMRRLELIQDSSIVVRSQVRQAEREARGAIEKFLVELVLDDKNKT